MFSGGSGGPLGSLGGLGSLGDLGSTSGLGLGSLSLNPDPSGSQGLPSLSDLAKADQQTSGFDLDTNLLKGLSNGPSEDSLLSLASQNPLSSGQLPSLFPNQPSPAVDTSPDVNTAIDLTAALKLTTGPATTEARKPLQPSTVKKSTSLKPLPKVELLIGPVQKGTVKFSKPSPFGKVLCNRWAAKRTKKLASVRALVRTTQRKSAQLVQFAFDKPSPDDVIREAQRTVFKRPA